MSWNSMASILVFTCLAVSVVQADDSIDFNRARTLFEREKAGEKLTEEEAKYLDRAKQEMRRRNEPPRPAPWTEHLTPLTELGTEKYKGQSGGLYGGGQNQPPAQHLAAAMHEVAQIVPRDAEGHPDPQGIIGLMSVGMSNATQEFSTFANLTRNDPERSPHVVLVDGAQGAMTATRWADLKSPVWPELDKRLQQAGVSVQQVQVIWMKQAEGGPVMLGEFPKHTDVLQTAVTQSLHNLKSKFPNLRIAYLSSRIYGGYATTPLCPEPYAYEGAFAMRAVIQRQIADDADLNWDSQHGEVKSPVVLWGPYLWADGATPRHADGLTFLKEDFGRDGTHPSGSGREKVAHQLSSFLKTDPTARMWYLRRD